MSFVATTEVWTTMGPKTMLELENHRTEVLVEVDKKLIYDFITITEAPSQNIVELTLDDETLIICSHDQGFFEKKGRAEILASSLGAIEFSPHKISGIRRKGLASIYRSKVGRGYRQLSNGYKRTLEHHIPFPELIKGDEIHHINGDRADSIPCNLKLVNFENHKALYHSETNSALYRKDININEAVKLQLEGKTIKEIAIKLGCSQTTISRRLGRRKPVYDIDETQKQYRTELSTLDMLALRDEGLSMQKISKVLGCSTSTVSNRIRAFKRNNHKVQSFKLGRYSSSKLKPDTYRSQLYQGDLPTYVIVCKKGGVLVGGTKK